MKSASTKAAKADRNAAARARRAKRGEERRKKEAAAKAEHEALVAQQAAEAQRRHQAEQDADAAIIVSAKTCVQEWLKEPRNVAAMNRAHAEQIRCVLNRRVLTNPGGFAMGLQPVSGTISGRFE